MPIANIITNERPNSSKNLIQLWAHESGITDKHMTINIMSSSQQFGNRYSIMANLLVPCLWSKKDMSLLQIGLAKALSDYFSVDISQVHIITTVVASGLVVESGQQIDW